MSSPRRSWSYEAVEDALYILYTRSLQIVEYYFGDPLALISGCLRSLLIAEEGKDLICSDFSAIEAVALAFMAREPWRMEVFRTHGKIYEMSASKITGVPFEEFIRYKKESGAHHPLRKKVGKVAELASGYRGWIPAWKQFGADEFFTNDDDMADAIMKWRNASPMIVKFWDEIQNAAQNAIRYPGQYFEYNGFTYACANDILYCKLLSGRLLQYWQPQLVWETTPWGKQRLSIEYSGWNTDRNTGPYGWIRMRTHGGKLTENIDQAVCRDILFDRMKALEARGYPVVMDTHDEVISEIPRGLGSIEEFESILGEMPWWCRDWPIKAAGGWRGIRYRKAD
jgi:DNA polymerase